MTKQFKAAVLHEVGKTLSIETVETGPLAPGDVLVRLQATSICHTDLEVLEGQLVNPLPIVLGHEGAGVVEAVGPAVTRPAPGDHVVLSWNPHCGHCYFCAQGQPILCEQYIANAPRAVHFDGHPRLRLGGRPICNLMYLGTFAEYCVVPAQCAVPVPAEIPADRACLIGCGVMTGVGAAKNVAGVGWGSSVMVLGCGAVGLSAVQGARMCGAAHILAVDVSAPKLALARQVGATAVCDAAAEDPLAAIRRLTDGRGADHVIECAGRPQAFRTAVEGVRAGGQVVWLGKVNVDEEVSFRWGSLMGERRIVRSSYGGYRAQDFPRLAQSYLRGELRLDEMITQRIPLAAINEGFDALRHGQAIRTVIEFPEA